MSFWKKHGKTTLVITLTSLMFAQQTFTHYRLSRSNQAKMNAIDGLDQQAADEINYLEKLWRPVNADRILTPQTMANTNELKQARARLKQAEIAIMEGEKWVLGSNGGRVEFYNKAYDYYLHSASVLLNIVDFLIAKSEDYSIHGDEVAFDNDEDIEQFQKLIGQLSLIHKEKEEIDAFILNHNRKVRKKSLTH